jgi:hypothetical protein
MSVRRHGFEPHGSVRTDTRIGNCGRTVFLLLTVVGFKRSSWLVVAALAGHGVFDFVHHFFIENPGVPHWWSGFCLAMDVTLAVWLAIRLGNLGPGGQPPEVGGFQC